MNRLQLRALLDQVQSGTLTPESAHQQLLQYLRQSPYENLEFARVDHHRSVRQGFPEVVYGAGKTPEQIAAISERIVSAGHNLLVTRTNREAFDAVERRLPGASFHEQARTITLRTIQLPQGRGTVLVVAAGTADLPVAEEAVISAEIMGNQVDRLYDVGVAGLHRLLAEQARLSAAHVVIVVAGMEGALPSVVGGLVDVPVIAVPTSVGYGASFASGVSVVNIDNGFGAAAVASAINHLP
jgi:NCAIR mutase (PurE)-related protein